MDGGALAPPGSTTVHAWKIAGRELSLPHLPHRIREPLEGPLNRCPTVPLDDARDRRSDPDQPTTAVLRNASPEGPKGPEPQRKLSEVFKAVIPQKRRGSPQPERRSRPQRRTNLAEAGCQVNTVLVQRYGAAGAFCLSLPCRRDLANRHARPIGLDPNGSTPFLDTPHCHISGTCPFVETH